MPGVWNLERSGHVDTSLSNITDEGDLSAKSEATTLDETRMWSVHRALSPLIGTAIHNGSLVRRDLVAQMDIDSVGRLREEDPFTEHFIEDVPNRIIVHLSLIHI